MLIRLTAIWLVFQMFYYDLISPSLEWDLGFTMTPDRLIFLVIVSVLAVSIMQNEIRIFPLSRLEVCMVLFTLICTISYIMSGADEGLEKHRHFTTLFNITYFPFTAYFIARSTPYRKETAHMLFKVLCFMGAYLALTAVFEHFRLYSLVWPDYITDPNVGFQFGRSRGPFIESAIMGRTLVATLLCGLVFMEATGGMKKVLLYLYAVVSIAAIYFTYTRGPWLGFCSALAVLAFSRLKLRLHSMAILLLLVFLFSSGFLNKFSLYEKTLFSARQNTVNNRLVVWNTALNMGKENILFGVGFGRFNKEWDNYYSDIKGIDFGGFDGNHNTVLGIFAELGIGATLVYLMIFYFMAVKCLRMYRQLDKKRFFEKNIAIIVLAMAASYFVASQFVDSRFHPLLNCIMFICFGIVSSMKIEARKKSVPLSGHSAHD